MVKGNIERSKAVIYFLLTAVFLLTFGPFNSTFSTFAFQWHIITFTTSTLLLLTFLFYYKEIFLNRETNLWIILCMVYAGFILAIYFFHRMAIYSIPDTFHVNAAGVKAMFWQRENTKFTIFYLFFPTLFLLQYILLKKLDTNVFIRFFALAITISLAILFYQSYADITFFNKPYWIIKHQSGGLSTDPNAYAMTAFLLLPLFIFGVFFETKKTIKAFYLTLIISLLIGMIFSGNRTGLGGVFLLAVSLPMILAMAYKQWPRHLRLILFISPLIFMILTYLVSPFIMNHVHSMDMGALTQRFVTTWDKFEEGGLARVFFYKEELRGRNFLIAWALLLKAPLAGWGPAEPGGIPHRPGGGTAG